MEMQTTDLGGIVYTNYGTVIKQGEQFVSEHVVSLLLSGSVRIMNGDRTAVYHGGDILFFRKNSLAKFYKKPAAQGNFTAIAVFLDQATLTDFYQQQHPYIHHPVQTDAVLSLSPDQLLQDYLQSLSGYFHELVTTDLVNFKKRELIYLLLRKDKLFKNILFDFERPGKIDLEAFMRQNFKYNVGLDKLAFLTGRSLATFKRDFQKIFNMPPSRWLKQERLKEAYYLLTEKGFKPSEVYLETGFESMPHFSFAFKQLFGKTPSELLQHNKAERRKLLLY